jgi:hypothetical protein
MSATVCPVDFVNVPGAVKLVIVSTVVPAAGS